MKRERIGLARMALGLVLVCAAPHWAAAQSAQPAAAACESLKAAAIPATAIALATNGAKAVSVTYVAAAGTPPRTVGAFCRVMVEIAPIDAKAPPIKMEINFPDDWNGKALMYGGGGLNGVILSTGGTIRLQPPEVAIPLGRGYVTFGSDSGHNASAGGTFALNDEALRNYALDAVKKTRDAAGVLIKARYSRPADKVYFHGSSNGGKEALGVIQRYPRDIDGAIIFWPATYTTSLSMQFGRISRAFMAPGAWVSVAKRKALHDAVLEACDGLDGAKDGVVSNVRACMARFDPANATLAGQPLRCASGADTGSTCLSDAEIRSLKVMATPLKLDFSLASGLNDYPGFYVWGAGLGISDTDELSKSVLAQGLGTAAPVSPAKPGMPYSFISADQNIRNFVTKMPDATWSDVDPEHPGKWRARFVELSRMMEMSKTDLAAFRRHGGKILLFHGLSDQIIPAQSTVDYYRRVVATMGQEVVSSFLKFYELPGTAHSGFGVTFNPTWDALGALDTWATKGVPPKSPTVTDSHFKPGRTRPLCQYPSWPKYKGSGDFDQASSFVCARS